MKLISHGLFIISNFTFVSSSILPSPQKFDSVDLLIMQEKKVECPWIFAKNTKQG
jgi:hypothetical protein